MQSSLLKFMLGSWEKKTKAHSSLAWSGMGIGDGNIRTALSYCAYTECDREMPICNASNTLYNLQLKLRRDPFLHVL